MAQMGLHRGPSGVQGVEQDMGSFRESPVASVPPAYQQSSAVQRRCVS